MSLAGSNGGRLLLKSNRDGFRADKDNQGSCSLHGTLHRDKRLRSEAGGRMWGSKEGGCNNPDLTMDDDMYYSYVKVCYLNIRYVMLRYVGENIK